MSTHNNNKTTKQQQHTPTYEMKFAIDQTSTACPLKNPVVFDILISIDWEALHLNIEKTQASIDWNVVKCYMIARQLFRGYQAKRQSSSEACRKLVLSCAALVNKLFPFGRFR